jgi:HSP20 family protein
MAFSLFPELRSAFRLLDDPFFERGFDRSLSRSEARPAIDVHERDGVYTVEAEVPGAKKEDLKIE